MGKEEAFTIIQQGTQDLENSQCKFYPKKLTTVENESVQSFLRNLAAELITTLGRFRELPLAVYEAIAGCLIHEALLKYQSHITKETENIEVVKAALEVWQKTESGFLSENIKALIMEKRQEIKRLKKTLERASKLEGFLPEVLIDLLGKLVLVVYFFPNPPAVAIQILSSAVEVYLVNFFKSEKFKSKSLALIISIAIYLSKVEPALDKHLPPSIRLENLSQRQPLC